MRTGRTSRRGVFLQSRKAAAAAAARTSARPSTSNLRVSSGHSLHPKGQGLSLVPINSRLPFNTYCKKNNNCAKKPVACYHENVPLC